MKRNRTLRPKFIQQDDEFQKNRKEKLYGEEAMWEMSEESDQYSGANDEDSQKGN